MFNIPTRQVLHIYAVGDLGQWNKKWGNRSSHRNCESGLIYQEWELKLLLFITQRAGARDGVTFINLLIHIYSFPGSLLCNGIQAYLIDNAWALLVLHILTSFPVWKGCIWYSGWLYKKMLKIHITKAADAQFLLNSSSNVVREGMPSKARR